MQTRLAIGSSDDAYIFTLDTPMPRQLFPLFLASLDLVVRVVQAMISFRVDLVLFNVRLLCFR